MIGDPYLNYFALFILFFVIVVLFYGIIAIHDIPHIIAKSRNHPHQDAIHAAGWVSLFTLHALWPFLWIWAMAYQPARGWGFSQGSGSGGGELEEMQRRIGELEARLGMKPESAPAPAPKVETRPAPKPDAKLDELQTTLEKTTAKGSE